MKIGIITLDNQPVGTIDLAMLEQDPTLQPVLPNMEVGAEAPDDFMTPGQRGAGPPIHIPRGAGRRGRTRGGDDEDSKVEPQFSREKKLLREDVRKRHGLPPEKESRGPSEGVEGPAPKNADDTYKKIRDRFEHSSLSGYVPRDGAKWGITKGTPDEWARLAVALGMQESDLGRARGGMFQFSDSDLRRYGVTGSGHNAQIEAMARQWERYIKASGVIAEPGGGPGSYSGWRGAAAFFGPFRRPHEILKHWGTASGIAARNAATPPSAGAGSSDNKSWPHLFGAPPSGVLGGGDVPPFRPSDADTSFENRFRAMQPRATFEERGAGLWPSATTDVQPRAPTAPGAMQSATGAPAAIIIHHTGGAKTPEQLANALRGRGLGVEYMATPDGRIVRMGGPGAANIMPEARYRRTPITGKEFLSNKNIIGIEVGASDDKHVTAAQIRAVTDWIQKNYPNTPVFGHGEVNPGHKEWDEGLSIARNIRDVRASAIAAHKTAPPSVAHVKGPTVTIGKVTTTPSDPPPKSDTVTIKPHTADNPGDVPVTVPAPLNEK